MALRARRLTHSYLMASFPDRSSHAGVAHEQSFCRLFVSVDTLSHDERSELRRGIKLGVQGLLNSGSVPGIQYHTGIDEDTISWPESQLLGLHCERVDQLLSGLRLVRDNRDLTVWRFSRTQLDDRGNPPGQHRTHYQSQQGQDALDKFLHPHTSNPARQDPTRDAGVLQTSYILPFIHEQHQQSDQPHSTANNTGIGSAFSHVTRLLQEQDFYRAARELLAASYELIVDLHFAPAGTRPIWQRNIENGVTWLRTDYPSLSGLQCQHLSQHTYLTWPRFCEGTGPEVAHGNTENRAHVQRMLSLLNLRPSRRCDSLWVLRDD